MILRRGGRRLLILPYLVKELYKIDLFRPVIGIPAIQGQWTENNGTYTTWRSSKTLAWLVYGIIPQLFPSPKLGIRPSWLSVVKVRFTFKTTASLE